MKQFRVRAALAALFAAAPVLGGCSGHDPRGFLAQATESEVQSARIKGKEALCERITHHAKLNEIPESLIHRVVLRESHYDPAARHGRYWGLMQISHATAKSMGYSGPPIGLLDPETNLRYAVAYLANAYRVAGGDEKRAQKLYERGFYYDAKRAGRLGLLHAALEDASDPKPAGAQSAERTANDPQATAQTAAAEQASVALDQAALEHNPANTENHLDSEYLDKTAEDKPAPAAKAKAHRRHIASHTASSAKAAPTP
jgi:Transglycosylase SLT domain